jgi:uncharacterized membrane protein YkoI
MNTICRGRFLFVLMIGTILQTQVLAQGGDHERARIAREVGEVQSLDHVIAEVGRSVPGKVINVDLVSHLGKYVYEVMLLTQDGRRTKLSLDAKTLEQIQK